MKLLSEHVRYNQQNRPNLKLQQAFAMKFSLNLRRTALSLTLAIAALTLTACATTPTGPSVTLKGHRYSVELAEDPASQERGLMFREEMADDHGMLFIFTESGMQAFWMKNTKIPLDMFFFDDQRRLVNVQERVPPCRADPCPPYPSSGPAMYVLELNAGQAGKIGVKAGDELTFIR
ncbi:MAG: DUF192 domain-containing protein [Dokdonella sp.]